jgi:hypothetical protein
MSTISASTTTTTAYKVTADTTGTLVLQTGSTPTTAVTIDTAQNLGLGVTPSAWTNAFKAFQIGATGSLVYNGSTDVYLSNNYASIGGSSKYIATAAATLYQQGSGVHAWYNAASGTAGNAITFTQAMTLDASGNLLVGTTTANSYTGYSTFQLGQSTSGSIINFQGGATSTSSAAHIRLDCSGTTVSALTIETRNQAGTSSTPIVFKTQETERARIDSSGNLLVGATSVPGAGSATTGAAFGAGGYISVQRSASTPCFFGRSNDGEVMALYSGTTQRGQVSISGATTTYGSFSDYRLKENIVPLTGAVAKVMALKPSTFNFIEFPEQTINGFIAHEVAEVEPIAVTGQKDAVDEEGKQLYQSVDPAKLVPILTAALQEQQALITSQQAALETLTNRISALENK